MPASRPNKVTIQEVAKRAGVSISSVSRVIGEHQYVSQKLRTRVERAIRELGYQPDFLAHSLRRGKTHTIGFLVGSIANPVMARVFSSASNALAPQGYAMLLVCSQNNPQLDVSYLKFLAHRQVDGVIVSSAAGGPDQAGPLLAELGIPAVMLDRARPNSPHISAVCSDHIAGMREAVKHLLDQGHRRIAFLGGPEHFYPARERLAGFQSMLREAGIKADPRLVRAVGMHESVGYVETLNLLRLDNPPTALIAGGNLILIGALQALHERNLMIGRDIALVGCDDIDLTRLYHPAITVIARDLNLFGETAAQLMIETIEKGGERSLTLPSSLVIRDSSRCVSHK